VFSNQTVSVFDPQPSSQRVTITEVAPLDAPCERPGSGLESATGRWADARASEFRASRGIVPATMARVAPARTGARGGVLSQARAWYGKRAAALCALAGVVSAGLVASRATAPAFHELGYLRQVERSLGAVRAVAESGMNALLRDDVQAALGAVESHRVLEALLGAWARLSLGRVGLLDLTTSARLPGLVLGLLAPVALYAIARPSLGSRAAGAAAFLLAVHPAWLHACAVTAEGARVGSTWLLVLAAHQASLGPSTSLEGRTSLCRVRGFWALVCGLFLGLGVALSEAALWVLPLLLVHYWVSRHRSFGRLARRALLPVPPSALACVVFALLASLALNPVLWKQGGVGLARWWFDPLSSPGLPAEFTGLRGVARAGSWLWDVTPLVTLVLAMAGLAAIAQRAFSSRSGRPSPRVDRRGLGLLLVLGLGFTLLLPAWLPRVLSPSVWRPEASLPFMALAGGWGLDAMARRWVGERRAPWAVAAGALLALTGLSGLSTVGRDGSEIGALALAIDRLGAAEIRLEAPDVPGDFWQSLVVTGRMRTLVRAPRLGETTEYTLRRGDQATGVVLGTVTRQGTVLWTFARR
jgi:hypothetical protein